MCAICDALGQWVCGCGINESGVDCPTCGERAPEQPEPLGVGEALRLLFATGEVA